MRGIVIAAGRGSRMAPLTERQPKCLLPIAGRTLLDWSIDGLRGAGCDEIVLVTGHADEAIARGDIKRVKNDNFENNNILHSLMCARDYLNVPCMISYSDIWVEPDIYRRLGKAGGDITLAVDVDWRPYYEGRTMHPADEAENVYADSTGSILRLGKHLNPGEAGELLCGEFLGLWKMTERGAQHFRAAFETIDAKIDQRAPFQRAKEWRKTYITDMVQHLIDHGTRVEMIAVERGWAELDTQQDYDRLSSIAQRQRLVTLVGQLMNKEVRP